MSEWNKWMNGYEPPPGIDDIQDDMERKLEEARLMKVKEEEDAKKEI